MLTSSFAWHVLARERGDHLVRVHVRGRARAGLEDVDRELVVELARGDPVAGCGDALGLLRVEEAELGVRARRGRLDASEPAGDGGRDRLAGDREVLDCLPCFHAPELPRRGLAHASESSAAPPRRQRGREKAPLRHGNAQSTHDGAGGTRWYAGHPGRGARRGHRRIVRRPGLGPQRRPARASDRSDARGTARARARLQGPQDRPRGPVRRRVQARHEQPLYPRPRRRARGSQRQGRHRRDPPSCRSRRCRRCSATATASRASACRSSTHARPTSRTDTAPISTRSASGRPSRTRSIATARPRPAASGTSASSTTRAAC